MSTTAPHIQVLGTPDLRIAYDQNVFHFTNNARLGSTTVVIIGSCRVVPFLNYLRLWNALNENKLHIICLNPIEMWAGVGTEVIDGVNQKLQNYQLGDVDYLICEHLQDCGMINTVRTSSQNVYESLGCRPKVEIRLPNWNDMHIFDQEALVHSGANGEYSHLSFDEKVVFIRDQTIMHKKRFLSHCSRSSFPDLAEWVAENWSTIRMGWTSNHPSLALLWKLFEPIAEAMQLPLDSRFRQSALYNNDTYKSTGFELTPVDKQANEWNF